MFGSAASGIGRIYRALFYGSSGTLSMGRVIVALGAANVAAILWLYVVWVAYVTLTDRMEQAAALSSSMSSILQAVLSSQVAAIATTWWVTKRYGENGAASQAQVLDPNATIGASTVPPEPAPVPPVAPVALTIEEPIPVALVDPEPNSDPNNPGGI